jgi:hypothetical protein
MSDPLSQVLGIEAKKRKLNNQDLSNLKSFMNNVGEIESNNIPDRYQNDSEDSAGRGKYQFENDKGSNAAKTAANRLAQWEKANGALDIPANEREELSKPSPNFAVLSEPVQDALFLVNMSIAPQVPFSDIARGKIPQKDAWIKYHWAGSEKEAPKKARMWDMRQMQNKADKAKTFISSLF